MLSSCVTGNFQILEKILFQDLQLHVENLNILTKYQAGFRRQKSPSSMLVKLTDECLQNMDNGLPTICVFIDLKKAFDTISHERLLTKLYLLNIRDKALDLLKKTILRIGNK